MFRSLLVVGLAAVAGALAVPYLSASSDNRKTLLSGIAFDLAFDLAYPVPHPVTNVDSPVTNTSLLYVELSFEGEVLTQQSFPVVDSGGIIVSSIKLRGITVQNTGVTALETRASWQNFSQVKNSTDFTDGETDIWMILPGVSLLPAIVVLVIAIATREVLWALFAGIWTGAIIVSEGSFFGGLLMALNGYLVDSLANKDHVFILLFSWFLSGMVAIIQRSGGGHGLATLVLKVIKTRRGAMLAIYGLGFVIFFDDYANTLILGSTMRPIADNFFISREKFAFLVDATTAPIASVAPISSWIGFELSLIQGELASLEDQGVDLAANNIENAYTIFLETIVSRYYPWFMLLFQFCMIFMGREFGPMLTAERRALDEGLVSSPTANTAETEIDDELMPKEDVPRRWWNGIGPIAVTFITVIVGLVATGKTSLKADGEEPPFGASTVFGAGDAYSALLWAAFFGSVTAMIMSALQYKYKGEILFPCCSKWIFCKQYTVEEFGEVLPEPLLDCTESLEVWVEGIKGLMTPTLILISAWGIGAVIKDVGCDAFFASVFSNPDLDYRALPVITFLIAAAISFCTGSSWGTMSMLFPMVVGPAWVSSGGDRQNFILVCSGILSGAVFGDHATAISDTTIMSALATKCDLTHHVETQLPYALVCALVSVVFGYVLGSYAYPPWAGLLIGFGVIPLAGFLLGVRVDHPDRIKGPIGRMMDSCCKGKEKGEKAPQQDADEIKLEMEPLKQKSLKRLHSKGSFRFRLKNTRSSTNPTSQEPNASQEPMAMQSLADEN